MPNSRRRKFSVHNDLGSRNKKNRQQIGLSSNTTDSDLKSDASENINPKPCYNERKIKHRLIVGQPSLPEKITDSKEDSTICKQAFSLKENNTSTAQKTSDKDATARSSDIDLAFDEGSSDSKCVKTNEKGYFNSHNKHDIRDVSLRKRDNHLHRVKVRSPKRRNALSECLAMTEKCEISTSSANLIQEVETEVISQDIDETVNCTTVIASTVSELSSYSFGDMCRICHGGESLTSEFGPMISACMCRGTVGRVHVKCLERWLTESGKSRCELCGTRYATRRVHRYGVPRAFIMWIMSTNAKQLMVDSLGIMLMSPLAVLAAWLSGRTLAGLMSVDAHTTPWPLASTFVLACMTLIELEELFNSSARPVIMVPAKEPKRQEKSETRNELKTVKAILYQWKVCYYCWVVSAATRHALGWWLWYRSQYEVRLELDN